MSLLRHHSLNSAYRRVSWIVSQCGLKTALVICLAEVEEHFVKTFDRNRGVSTSGYIKLDSTSVGPDKRSHSSNYRPVNAWAFRRFLGKISLPKNLHFVDLGCGLGRACIIAAEYGFAQVTGVDFVSEFCVKAKENLKNCGLLAKEGAPCVRIIHADALNFCEQSDADIYFMYRAFSADFLRSILESLIQMSKRLKKTVTIIYSENVMIQDSHLGVFSIHQELRCVHKESSMGFQFVVYRYNQDTNRDKPDTNAAVSEYVPPVSREACP